MSAVLFMALFGFCSISCQKEEISDLKDDVRSLEDSLQITISQHAALLDSISHLIALMNETDSIDINALKMEQISYLMINIVRQPEAAEELIQISELLYSDYTELQPLSKETVIQRGIVIKNYIASVARQPEMAPFLEEVAERFIGPFDPDQMQDDQTEGVARGSALSGLIEGIARQPELLELLDKAIEPLILPYNANMHSNQLIDVSKAMVNGKLVEGIARQPEAAGYLDKVCFKYLNFNLPMAEEQPVN